MGSKDPNPCRVQLRLLGGFDLQSEDGRAGLPAGRKVRALLACLALAPDVRWPREKLMALLWSDRAEEQARASLRQALAEMRRVLGAAAALRAEQDTVSLDPVLVAVDVHAFERLARSGAWEEAATLYRGQLLEGQGVRDDAFDDWLRVERARLHQLALTVFERLAASQSSEAAIATAQCLLQFDPAREETHRLLMRLHAAAGQRTQALRQYEHCREILQRELQAAPDAETERLHREIRDEGVGPAAPAPAAAPSGMPSIVVLPFANLSGDAEQEYFSDGITNDIITELSRFHEIMVTASGTAFRFKGGNADVREIAARLGVNYVVEGSVRRSGNRVRITAQLIDAETANHVWAERYDREFADVFDLQDELARTIVIAVAGRLDADGAARARRKGTSQLSAYDLYLRGREYELGYKDCLSGEPYFLKAIELDPRFARAHAHLGLVSVMKFIYDRDRRHLETAEAWGRRAAALDGADAWCQLAVGYSLIFQKRLDEAGHYLEKAVALNPNNSHIGTVHAMWLCYSGRSAESLAALAAILLRDPMPPDWYWDVLAPAQTAAGLHAEAIASYGRMLNPPDWADAYLAICHVGLGEMDSARAAAARFSATPLGTVATFLAMEVHRDPHVCERFRAALLTAGVPEGD